MCWRNNEATTRRICCTVAFRVTRSFRESKYTGLDHDISHATPVSYGNGHAFFPENGGNESLVERINSVMKQSIGMMFPKLLFNSGESLLWKWGHIIFFSCLFFRLSVLFLFMIGRRNYNWKSRLKAEGIRRLQRGRRRGRERETDDVRTSLFLYLPLAKRASLSFFFWRPGSPELPITPVREHRPDGGKGRLILFYLSSLRALVFHRKRRRKKSSAPSRSKKMGWATRSFRFICNVGRISQCCSPSF